MTLDYFVDLKDKMSTIVQEYDRKLSTLEQRMRNKRGKERSTLRSQIEERITRLRTHLQQDISAEPIIKVVQTLATCFLDDVMVWWLGEMARKEDARADIYIPVASKLTIEIPGKIADDMDFRPDFNQLPSSRWIGLEVEFELLTPWYSKDDRLFHVMDNPVRKDRVFGVPFMAASSWKGMLRWACRMLELKKDWILHLFGNEKGEEKDFHQGTLVFYPTWFNKIGFEVINPHSRERRAGTQPICYEVVPPGAKGTLYLLYPPWSGMKHTAKPEEVLPELLEAIETLLTTYGISAKRTVGWGTARIEKWRAYRKDQTPVEERSREDFWNGIVPWLDGGAS